MKSPTYLPPMAGQAEGVSAMDSLVKAAKPLAPAPNNTVQRDVSLPPEAAPDLDIAVADWDALFTAVTGTLRHIVGERLGELPDVPAHSAALTASLVQAVVLDCAGALDRLHAALKQERSRRPTP